MNRVIYKLELKEQSQTISVTKGYKILSTAIQRDTICVWIEVDKDQTSRVEVTLEFYGTGHPLPEDPGLFIGSVMSRDHSFVFHVYSRYDTAPQVKGLS